MKGRRERVREGNKKAGRIKTSVNLVGVWSIKRRFLGEMTLLMHLVNCRQGQIENRHPIITLAWALKFYRPECPGSRSCRKISIKTLKKKGGRHTVKNFYSATRHQKMESHVVIVHGIFKRQNLYMKSVSCVYWDTLIWLDVYLGCNLEGGGIGMTCQKCIHQVGDLIGHIISASGSE